MREPFSERKYRRFDLTYPVRLRVQTAGLSSEIQAMSSNVSLCGLLLETTSAVPQGSAVSFVMTIQTDPVARPVELAGEGNVVRIEQASEAFRIAVECKTPLTQIESCFPQPC